MFERSVQHIDELPLPQKDRKTTDVCCGCIGIVFVVVMVGLTFANFQKVNHTKTTLFTDSLMRTCSFDLEAYPYVFFADPQDTSKRLCVKTCPTASTSRLDCQPFSRLPCQSLPAYPTTQTTTLLGGICMPTDGLLKNTIFKNAKLANKWGLLEGVGFLKETLIVSVVLGVVWVIVVEVCTRVAVWVAVIGAMVVMFVVGVIPAMDQTLQVDGAVKALMVAVPMVMVVFLGGTICVYRSQIRLSEVFLSQSAKFLRESFPVFLFIIPMVLLTLILLLISTLQHFSFKSMTQPHQSPGSIFWQSDGNVPLIILNILGAIWGIQFLRDTFNFFISGNAVEWYFTHRQTQCCTPIKRFFRRNFGTVVGGSFLNAFLEIPAFFMEILTCEPQGCCGKCSRPCYCLWGYCQNVLDLARNDSYAYTNLTGIPYCNSSRNCQYLCNQSKLFIGRQSPIKLYRFCSQVLLIGHQLIYSYVVMKAKYGAPSLWGLLLVFILSYCVIGYFTNIHADGADALQVCFFTEYQIENQVYEQMNRCSVSMRQQVQELDQMVSRPYYR